MSARKKLILLGLTVLLCSPLAAYAASIGDPQTQGQFKFGIGLDQEFMFKRDIKFKSASFELYPGEEVTNSEIKDMYRTTIKGSFGIFDFLDVYVKLGTAKYKGEMGLEYRGVTEESDKFKTKWGFAYGGGLKGAYTFKNGFLVGGDLQYLTHKQKADTTWTDETTGEGGTVEGKATFQEWHVAPYVGWKIQNVTPYLGLKYSDVRVKVKPEGDGGEWVKFKADDKVGVFGGISYEVIKNLKLNLEGRFIDETALSLSLTYKFN
jgi:opacity protein-like surface antigen